MCDWAHGQDQACTLGAYFTRPQNLTDAEVEQCVDEEGWILGAT